MMNHPSWTRWMRGKYLKHVNFWKALEDNHNSSMWKEILTASPIALKSIRHKLVTRNISFWKDVVCKRKIDRSDRHWTV